MKGPVPNTATAQNGLGPSSTPHLQAVTFDVGGTLIATWPSVGHIYAEVAAQHGLPGCSVPRLNQQFAAAWRAAANFNYSRTAWAELVDAAFRGLSPKPPSQTFFSALYDRFSEPEAWHVFEDVVPALEALAARGLKLGVISNWDDRLVPLLRRLKLHAYFQAEVVSCQLGAPKPSATIFEQAARELALSPGAILHVGDSPEMDLAGARAAGFQAVLVRRGDGAPQHGVIRSLRELH